MLTLLETLTGVVTIALMISYLPALYGAYSRREARLLTLDDPHGGRITPVRVIAVNAPGGDVEMLYRSLAEWQMWTADVLESHVSYPMLALFRSQHPGQSWVTALGVVTDAATLTSACVAGAQSREPYFLYRRGRRAIVEISSRLHVPAAPTPPSWLVADNFELAWSQLVSLGVPLRDKDEAWADLQALRASLRGPARAPDRLPGRSARVLGPLGRGDGRGGGGRGRPPRPGGTRARPLAPHGVLPAPVTLRAAMEGSRRSGAVHSVALTRRGGAPVVRG